MKPTLLLTILLAIVTHRALAQNQYIIQGKINGADNAAIANALVSLIQQEDSATVTSVVADKDGGYKISAAAIADMLLKIDATGYTVWYSSLNSNAQQQVNAVLQKNKMLSEVAIVARKPVYEQKPDRTVFNVENSVTATGSDAWNALRKTPGILIMGNSVTISGKGAVGVMINGRMQQVAGEDLAQLLRSIPSDNLSKIEVITTPPARYDAEGNMGLINIVTKKNLKQGFKGSVTASYKRNALSSPSLSTTMSYGSEKLNVTVNAATSQFCYQYVNRTNTYFPGQVWEQELISGYTNRSARFQLAADYKLTKNMTIGIVAGEAMNTLDFPDSSRINIYDEQRNLDSTIRIKGWSLDKFKGKHSLNLNYEWRFDDKGKKLNIDADYYGHKGTRLREFDMISYQSGGDVIAGVSNRMSGSPSVDIRSIKADLELPFKFAKLTTGIKASEVNNVADNIHELRINEVYTRDLTRTNTFEYNEQIQAAYITAQRKIGKVDIQAGVRAEHTHTEGYSPTLSRTDINDYTQFFPSGYVQYSLSDNHSFNANYSRRINRPAYSFLNPFRLYYSANSYAEGNPYLRPSYRNGVELGYVYKSKYFFKAFASQTNNYWDRIIETDAASGTTRYTRANVGRGQWSGLGASTMLNPYKWWEFRVGINLEHNDFKLSHFGRTDRLNSTFPWADMNHSFVLDKKKTLTAEVYAYYYAQRQKDYKIWGEMSTVNIGIRKTFMNNNMILALRFDDIFAKAYWFQTNIVNGTTEYSYDNEQGVGLSLTWKFGNKNIKGKRDKAVVEEIQRASQ
ncbi:MAG: TonB-dependent receptor [Sphingobacteriales bacterium]|nr:MAG: TonB-dependent receptor [Sphingobacteriales bacterium]